MFKKSMVVITVLAIAGFSWISLTSNNSVESSHETPKLSKVRKDPLPTIKSNSVTTNRKHTAELDTAVPDWTSLKSALANEDRAIRLIAVQKLSKIRTRQSLLLLINALRDKDPAVSSIAARAIEDISGYPLSPDRPITQGGRDNEARHVTKWLIDQKALPLVEIRRKMLLARAKDQASDKKKQ